jgi:hypothetical protein
VLGSGSRVRDTAPPPAPRRRGLVIAWMPVSQRSTTLGSKLGFEVVLLGRVGYRRPWTAAAAYPWLAVRTIATLLVRRPSAVIVVAPPFVAPLVAVPVASMIRVPVAVDVHSGAFLDRRWRWSLPILAWITARATAGVVTLESLARLLRSRGARALVIPDPVPRAAVEPAIDEAQDVVLICGWGDDEPIAAAVEAARGRSWRLAVTGKQRYQLHNLPDNVRLLGFLAEDRYAAVIGGARLVLVLTTREDTLLSGAWEALAHRRPLVLSDTRALRETFGSGATYVQPTTASIRRGVESALADPTAESRTVELATHFERANDAALDELRAALLH